MNIYFDSAAGGRSSYPLDPTFSNIEVSNIIIHNALTIDGIQKGSILICENNTNDVGDLLLGDEKNVLCVGAAGLPEWRNYLAGIDYIETNQIKIPTVQSGDLLVGENTSFFGRLPCGANNQILYSNGTTLGWQNKTEGNQYFYHIGGTIPQITPAVFIGANAFNLVNGRRYKFDISAQVSTANPVNLTLSFAGSPVLSFGYSTTCDMAKSFLYTAGVSGAILVEISGNSTGAADTLINVNIFGTEF